jgi:hypothetical protein
VRNYTVLNNNLRVYVAAPDAALNAVGEAYTNIFTYSGDGMFSSAILDFNHENILVQIEIDGVTMFTINCKILHDMLNTAMTPTGAGTGNPHISWDGGKRMFGFTSAIPIDYKTSLIIRAKSNDSNTGRKIERYIITNTEGF